MNNFTVENLISVPASSVPSGTLVIKIGQNAFIANSLNSGIDTSDATASAQLILSGYTAYVDGTKIEGTIPTVHLIRVASTITVPSGFIAEQEQITIPDSNITIEGNQVTIQTGYVAQDNLLTVGTAIPVSSILPGVTSIVIPSGSYLNGDQTILGDANLVPSSIVSGVTIFGVSGTFAGSTPTEFYKCAEVNINQDSEITSFELTGFNVRNSINEQYEVNGIYEKCSDQVVNNANAQMEENAFAAIYTNNHGCYIVKYTDGNYYKLTVMDSIFAPPVCYSDDNGITWNISYDDFEVQGIDSNNFTMGTITSIYPNQSWSGYKLTITSNGITYANEVTSGLTGDVEVGGIYSANGSQRIYEDTLIPANIKSGTTILGVSGTMQGAIEFYKCASITPGGNFIEITGVGTLTDINGLYSLKNPDATETARIWTKDNDTYIIDFTDEQGWRILKNGTLQFSDDYAMDFDSPIDVSNWSQWDDATGSPVLSEIVGNASWSGYKLNITSGGITYANEATSGLTGNVEVGGIYSEDGTKRIYENTLIPANIKAGTTILGVLGTLQEGVDTSDATAAASSILAGETAYVNGVKVTGNITSKSAQTYTPTTTAQTITAGQYLSEDQTIAGDPNLVASNIVSGVSIFGVSGSYATPPTTDLYKCTEIIPGETREIVRISNAGIPDCEGDYVKNPDSVNSPNAYKYVSPNTTWYFEYNGGDGYWALMDEAHYVDGGYFQGVMYIGSGTWTVDEYGNPIEDENGHIIITIPNNSNIDAHGVEPAPTIEQLTIALPGGFNGKKLIASNGNIEFASQVTSGLTLNGFTPVTGMIYMVTNNEIVACLSSLVPENIIAGSEILGVSGSAQTGSNVTLGVVDANNNFQSLAFDGTSAVTSGEPISTNSYQTWNSPYNTSEGGGASEPITPEPEEETGADVTASYIVSGMIAQVNEPSAITLTPINVSQTHQIYDWEVESYNGYVWGYNNYLYSSSIEDDMQTKVWLDYQTGKGFKCQYVAGDGDIYYKNDNKPDNIVGTYACGSRIITVTKAI